MLTAKKALTKKELDYRIENWLAEKWDCHIDFEIGDAVHKPEHLKLIGVAADHLRCVPLDEAKQQFDSIWEDRNERI